MAKVKYYYDSETLSYKKIKTKMRNTLKKISLAMVSAFMFMVLGFVVFTQVFESPKEKELKRELEFVKLNEELHSKKIAQLSEILKEIQDRDNNIYRLYFEVNPVARAVVFFTPLCI